MKQITSRTVHQYGFYSDGKIKTDRRVTYYSTGTKLWSDTTTSEDQYYYNESGLIDRVFDNIDSTKEFRFYDELDSLIGEVRINRFGDTTYLVRIEFQAGREVRRSMRFLVAKLPSDPENLTLADFRNYDTTYYFAEQEWKDGKLHKIITRDRDGTVTDEIEHIYAGDWLIENLTYSFFIDAKYLRETTIYGGGADFENDYTTVGLMGDTTSFRKTTVHNDGRNIQYYVVEPPTMNTTYYNKTGQLIGDVSLNFADELKYVYAYTYDDRGNVIEESSYIERLIID